MPLLINEDALQPLFTSRDFYPQLFQIIHNSLLHQIDAQPGTVSWMAFPTSQENHFINFHLLTTPQEGTSVRVFPHRVGPQAKDSMFSLLFDDQDGHLLALIALDEIAPLRTAAPVAFASQYLAPKNIRTLALFGSGLQARYHLLSIQHALPSLQEIRVYSPTAEHRQNFTRQMQATIGLKVVATETPKEAVNGADIIVVTAGSREHIFAPQDIRPGALVTSIVARAIPPELYGRARVVVPSLVGPEHHPTGWDPFPFRLNGGRDPSTVAVTLVDVLHGKSAVRQSEDEIVVYEQSGSFAWDGAMTRWLYDWAVKHNAGSEFSISSRSVPEL